MKVSRVESVVQNPVTMPGSKDCQVRWLVDESCGAPNFAMREFEVAPGGYTPRHSHPYEHEIYVLEGQGVAIEDETEHPISAGDFLLVTPDEIHQFRNTGSTPMRFLCLVPNSSAHLPVTLAPECGRPTS